MLEIEDGLEQVSCAGFMHHGGPGPDSPKMHTNNDEA
jgi:hypothetical protein